MCGGATNLWHADALGPFAGCESCPPGYFACLGRCWRRLDKLATYVSAYVACLDEAIATSGDPLYISLATPKNRWENECAIWAAGTRGSWLGWMRLGSAGWIDSLSIFLGVPITYMSYAPWAEGQPTAGTWGGGQNYMALIPPIDPPDEALWAPGWYDHIQNELWWPLCATRYCR